MTTIDWNATQNLVMIISTSILAMAAIGAFIFNGIYIKKIEISNRLTKEKEKTDRAILYLDKFYQNIGGPLFSLNKKKQQLISRKQTRINIDDEAIWYEIRDVLTFFNFLSILINEDKVDFNLVNRDIGSVMRSFLIIYLEEMEDIIKKLNPGGIKRYSLKDYFEVCLKIDEGVGRITEEEKIIINKLMNA